jgi:heme exporter protein C
LWWRDVHQPPTLLRPDELQMDAILLAAFFAGLVAYAIVATSLIVRRYRLAALEDELEQRMRAGAGSIAGDAIAAPQLERRP